MLPSSESTHRGHIYLTPRNAAQRNDKIYISELTKIFSYALSSYVQIMQHTQNLVDKNY
jgi:hypothetical protein